VPTVASAIINAVTGSIHLRFDLTLSSGATLEVDICTLESVATDETCRLGAQTFHRTLVLSDRFRASR